MQDVRVETMGWSAIFAPFLSHGGIQALNVGSAIRVNGPSTPLQDLAFPLGTRLSELTSIVDISMQSPYISSRIYSDPSHNYSSCAGYKHILWKKQMNHEHSLSSGTVATNPNVFSLVIYLIDRVYR